MATERARGLGSPPTPPNAGGSLREWGEGGSSSQTAGCGEQHSARPAPGGSPRTWGAGGGRIALLILPLLVLLLAASLPARARADALDDQVRAIARQLWCPVCNGETVADSNAQISVQMRGIIRQKLEAGETPEQIRAYFVARYGERILVAPPAKGFTLGVWIAPIVALLIGLAIVGMVLRSWLRRGPAAPAATDAARPALLSEDDERLERELAQFRRGGVAR